MTASALASPALSESSLSSSSKAQTSSKTESIEQSHSSSQSALFEHNNNMNNLNALSPASTSSSSFSPSPSPSQQHSQIHTIHNTNNSHPSHPMFTPSSTQQHHHQLQILGNHPASPVACTFLDLPEDPFMPTRPNQLLFDSEYRQGSQESSIYESEAFMPYGTTTSAATPAAAGENEYIYSQSTSSSYVMPMSRTFSDSQLSDMCESSSSPFDSHAAAAALAGQAGLNHATGTAMCQSPLAYNSQVVYNDDYYASAHQHNLYSQQHSQSHHYGHSHSHSHHHNHSYSTSSLSSISEDSTSLSPRSPFSNHGSMSLSSSCNSLSSYPLSRTLSEPSVPFFQAMGGNNNSMSSSADGGNNNNGGVHGSNGTSLVKPTPKRSRGRRVSCNPDNSGCKVFTCRFEDCGKIFKRSEHLKRHVRSIHTMEKPFECPIMNCPKRFSRSDNLNQHIRIHRHNGRGEKNKAFGAFTPFLQNYPNELFSS
ncbi:hypothetical protein BGX24_007685 [Mortierella sp. AD032]|nr:hypothetical protein BGX24_007685 [Mortierella sp. AD032]